MTKCGKCGGPSRVIDSRPEHDSARRRRQCFRCDYRWWTVEVLEDRYASLVWIARTVEEAVGGKGGK